MEKQEFQVGDIVYCIDEDFREFEDKIIQVSLLKDGTLEYTSINCVEFDKKRIGRYVFKTKEDRNDFLRIN